MFNGPCERLRICQSGHVTCGLAALKGQVQWGTYIVRTSLWFILSQATH